MTIPRYWRVLNAAAEESSVACSERSEDLFLLPLQGTVADWKPLTLTLASRHLADYLPNDLGVRMCSQKMRKVLSAQASATDTLQWLDVVVSSPGGVNSYSILHFPEPSDVIDLGSSVRAGNFVIKAVLSLERTRGHTVFTYQGAESMQWFVSDAVKRILVSEGCDGLKLIRAPAV